jgi:hypothetical protein
MQSLRFLFKLASEVFCVFAMQRRAAKGVVNLAYSTLLIDMLSAALVLVKQKKKRQFSARHKSKAFVDPLHARQPFHKNQSFYSHRERQ